MHFNRPKTTTSASRHSTAAEHALHTLTAFSGSDNDETFQTLISTLEPTLRSSDDYTFLLRELGNRGECHKALLFYNFSIQRERRNNERGKLASAMIGTLGRLGKADIAKTVFESALSGGYGNTVYAFSALISAYGRSGLHEEAISVFNSMRSYNLRPNLVTYNAVIDACGKGGMEFSRVVEFLEEMERNGVQPDRITFNSLLGVCSRGGLWEVARSLFDEMVHRKIEGDVFSYNTLLDALCKGGQMDLSFDVLAQMRGKRIMPNVVSYSTVIDGFAKAGRFEEALSLFDEMRYLGIALDRVSYNTLLSIYTKAGRDEEALDVLREMASAGIKKDVVTYNALLGGYGKQGKYVEVKSVFDEMKRERVLPNLLTYSTLIDVYSKGGLYREAMEVFREFKSVGLRADVVLYSALIDALCKNGLVGSAVCLIDEMSKEGISPNVVTYNSIIDAFRRLHSVDGSSEMATSAGRATATTPLLGTAARDDRRRYCGGRLSRGACVGLAATVSVTLGLMFGSLLGLFVVAPHVVKARASSATIDFKSIAMSNPNKSSVDVHVDFSIDTHSVFSAFVAATDIDVLVGGKTLGTFSLPASKLQSSSPTVMHLASTLVVDPSGPFFSFAQSLLTEEHVEWTLRSHLKLTPSVPIVGNLSDVEVDLEKVVKLRGFSGLHPVVSSFTFANSSTATDVIADVVVTIDNPTVFTFDPIGELSLDVKAGKSMVGNASTPVWSLFPGKNVGMRVKAHVFGTDENHEVLQAIVGELVHGRDIELSASSVTTSLSLYNPALANTTMNLTLPGSGEPIGIIQNISTNELTTWAVDDEHAALAGQLDMRLTDALLGPLCHVSLVSVLDATLEVWSVTASSPEDPVLVGTLHVPWAPASPGSDPFSFRLQLLNASTTLPDGAAPFRDFFMLVASVSGPIGHVKVAGNARASVITPIGKFTVRDINFDVPVVIRGADGFPSDTDSWRIFDGADGSLGIIASLTVTNPSNCALRLGDSELSIADGIDDEERYGVMPLSDFTISTGINTYSNVSGTLNVSSAAQKDQVSSLLSSVVAGSQDASATFQVVKFATGSKAAWANDIFKELAFIVSPPIDGHASPIRSMRFGKQAPTFTFVHGESTNASAKLSGVHVVVELHVPKWVEADLQISGIQSLTFTVNDKKVDVVKKDCQASHVGSRYDIDVNLSEVNFDMSLSPSEVFASERVTVKSSISSPSFTSRRGLTISLPDSSTASSLVVAGLSHLEDSQSTCIVGDSGRISSDGSLFFKSEVLLPTSRSRDHPAIYEFGEMQLALTSGAKLVFDNLRFGQSETQTAWITLTPKQLVSVIGHKGVIDRTGHDGFVPLTVSVTAPRFASFLSSVEGKLSDLQNYRNATHVPISISVCNPLSNVNLDLRIVGDGGISLNGIHLLTWSGSFLASASGTNCLVVHIDDTNVASRDESTWTSLLNSLKSGPARVALRGTFNTIFKDKQADRHVAIPIVLTHTATNLAAH